ncbi:lysylphosphatidylglycerol synthase transmembrane domain-containing protein [Catenuloplanes japonicus]|uniref:lysylphosphatidylglycerol synthase transmembrane domain-containing protein n=1 Tax=Catenuloplanes japonicus TaxID=33876 RepID=UPI0007C49F1F|nr:lysylphosphatidylglycerol synthase transmembrane domain-containing protein [Catenuloplanes japonicus]
MEKPRASRGYETDRATHGRWRRWRPALLVALGAAAVFLLRDRLPDPDEVWTAITTASPWWLLLGVAAEWVSLAMFARQQMWLLRGLGVAVGIGPALAMTYSRSAIAITMPAGSAMSAGFAYQTFRRWGASREAATTVMVLSGAFSVLGLVVLYVLGYALIVLEDPGAAWSAHPVATVAAAAGVLTLAAMITASVLRDRRRAGPVAAPAALGDPPAGRIAALLATLRAVGPVALGMHGRYRRIALLFAVINWFTDLCCLAAVAYAFHLPLTFVQLGAVYVVVQLVRQIPVTPGGIGVIEASLLAALVSAGAAQGPAAAAVLGYRLLSCWLIIPAGLFTWAVLRRSSSGVTVPAR